MREKKEGGFECERLQKKKKSYGPKQPVSCWAVTGQIIPHIMTNISHFKNSVNEKKSLYRGKKPQTQQLLIYSPDCSSIQKENTDVS